MTSPADLRSTLIELADSARDVPEMPVTRAGRLHGQRRTGLWLAAASGVLVVLVALGLVGNGRLSLLPLTPAAAPTRAVPPISPAVTSSEPEPSAPGTPTAAPSTPWGSRSTPTTRALTAAEISRATRTCLGAPADLGKNRQGRLRVRYATWQAPVGYPVDGAPRTVLLLEDDGGYFDCSEADGGLWVSKDGDDVHLDRSAAGWELPTISGGNSSMCGPPRPAASVRSTVALHTAPQAHTARVVVHARGGARTTTVPTREGYVYVSTLVSGEPAWHSSRVTVELFDSRGRRLPVQPYLHAVTDRLEYPLHPCAPTGR